MKSTWRRKYFLFSNQCPIVIALVLSSRSSPLQYSFRSTSCFLSVNINCVLCCVIYVNTSLHAMRESHNFFDRWALRNLPSPRLCCWYEESRLGALASRFLLKPLPKLGEICQTNNAWNTHPPVAFSLTVNSFFLRLACLFFLMDRMVLASTATRTACSDRKVIVFVGA